MEITFDVGKATNWTQTPFTRSTLTKLVLINETPDWVALQDRSEAIAAEALNFLQHGERKKALSKSLEAFPDTITDEIVAKYFQNAFNALNRAYVSRTTSVHFDKSLAIAEFSKNGSTVVATYAQEDGRGRLFAWDGDSGDALYDQLISGDVVGVYAGAFGVSPNGRYIAHKISLAPERSLRIMIADLKTGNKVVSDITNNRIYLGPYEEKDIISTTGFSPSHHVAEFSYDSSKLLIVASPQAGQVNWAHILDVSTGARLHLISQIPFPDGSLREFGHARLIDNERICFGPKSYFNEDLHFGVYNFVREKLEWHRMISGYEFQGTGTLGAMSCAADGKRIVFAASKTQNSKPNIFLASHDLSEVKQLGSIATSFMSLSFDLKKELIGVRDDLRTTWWNFDGSKAPAPPNHETDVETSSGVYSKEGKRIGWLHPNSYTHLATFGHSFIPSELISVVRKQLEGQLSQNE